MKSVSEPDLQAVGLYVVARVVEGAEKTER